MTAKTEDVFQARGPIRLAETEGCTIWQFRNKTGDGTMAAYEVFPGAMVSFNDFHMARYDSGYVADRELLAIDHCREGRMEYQAGENAVAYTEAGDVKLDRRKGAVIAIDCNKASARNKLLRDLQVMLAGAMCKGITRDEVDEMIDMIYDYYEQPANYPEEG